MKPSREFLATLVLVLIAGGAVVFGVLAYRDKIDADVDSALYIAPDVEITEEIRWLQRYVQIDTTNPPGNEVEGARFLQGILASRGIESELIESAPGRASLYARIRGRRSDDGFLLLHHIDVAPAGDEGWRRPPFSGDIVHGYLWGRGTLDMKGIGIAHLSAFLEVASRSEPPARDIVFLAVADEEEGSAAGMQWLLEHRPDLFEGVTECVNEGGVTEMIAGQLTYFGIETGSLAQYRYRLESSDPDVLRRARLALGPMLDPVEPVVIEPEVEEFFRSIAPVRQQAGPLLADIRATVDAGQYYRLPENYRLLTEVRAHVLPLPADEGREQMTVLVSAPPRVSREVVDESIRRSLSGLPLEIHSLRGVPPAPHSPTSSDLFHQIGKTAQETFGPATRYGPVVIANAATDSRFLRAAGIDCYGFWPYPVDFFLTQAIHRSGERVRLDYFMQGVGFMKRLVDRIAAE